MAIACFLLVTFLPLRPDLRVPFFRAFISVPTLLPAAGEYLRPDDFVAAAFFLAPPAVDAVVLFFLVADFFALDFLAVDFFAVDFFALVDLFFAAFFVAMQITSCRSDVPAVQGSCLPFEDPGQGVHVFPPL